jgi:hypothetical protein
MTSTHDLLICECENIEHQIIFSYFEDDDIKEVYMSIHLIPEHNIFKRIWKAIKYVFGYRCEYGHFDEMILKKSDAKKLLNILKYLDPNILKE